MKAWLLFIWTLSSLSMGFTEIQDHFKKDSLEKTETSPIRGIDFIYMINLDQRPEKWEKSLKELAPYGIKPHRFSAIYGWDLSFQTLQEVGVKFSPEMEGGRWVSYYTGKKEEKRDFLRPASYGKTVFSSFMHPGAIGCALSHLSVLQDAYDSGYETILVMEDDVIIKKDPNVLSDLIDRLDSLIGKDGWDILYTDMDSNEYRENYMHPLYSEDNDHQSDLKGDFHFFWRPDLDLSDHAKVKRRTALSAEFLQVGSRSGTYSMIIRRSGMKKILEFVKQHHIFLAYDHELAAVPGIRLVNVREPVVTTFVEAVSDTHVNLFDQKKPWEECRQFVLKGLSGLFGWVQEEAALRLVDSIQRKKPELCVEIGAFGGVTTFPIACALQTLGRGVLYAIDAWDNEVAIQGMKGIKSIQWWKELDMHLLYQKYSDFFAREPFQCYVRPIRKTSKEASFLFADDSIDFLVLDGNPSEEGSLEDVLLYVPKVKEGGYIWMQNAQLVSKNKAMAYLFKHAKQLETYTTEDQSLYVLFEKENIKGHM